MKSLISVESLNPFIIHRINFSNVGYLRHVTSKYSLGTSCQAAQCIMKTWNTFIAVDQTTTMPLKLVIVKSEEI